MIDEKWPTDPILLREKLKDPEFGLGYLKNITLFKRFEPPELKTIYETGDIQTVPAKVNIVIEGEGTHGLYIILAGTVSVYKNELSTGQMRRIALLEEKSSFGEMSLFDDAPRSATVVAENTCHLFHLSKEAFHEFLESSKNDAALRFYQTCAEDLVERFRKLNSDYIKAQQLLWTHALSREKRA